jgi:hypothetical protein
MVEYIYKMKIEENQMTGITKNMTKEERLAVIKTVAERFKKKQALRASLAEGAKRVRRWTDEVETPRRKAKAQKFDDMIARLDENHNHYTDGSKYLAEHYGDRVAAQRDYDNDWN